MNKTQITQLALGVAGGLFIITGHLAALLLDKTLEAGKLSEEMLRGESLPLLNSSIECS